MSISVYLNDSQEADLMEFIGINRSWTLFDNCASFAARAWAASGQQPIGYKSLFFIPTPIALMRSIKRISGYQVDAKIDIGVNDGLTTNEYPTNDSSSDSTSSDSSSDSSSNSFGDSSYFFQISLPL